MNIPKLIFKIFWIFFMKLCEFFPNVLQLEQFLMNLNLGKIFNFFPKVWDTTKIYENCIAIQYTSYCLKTPKNMFLTKFYEIGHFLSNYRTFIFELFCSKNIFYSTKWPIWSIWPADWPMWLILKFLAKTYVFKKG